ncbi:carbon-nitrogen hydrolase family protein [Litorisediminicola beolgyonensis]|uniref:Carbon-nitrogen hydrolase family protein n=1 Tax=Litorisediminicola beolgyonensis TaxID=1173614 RepID=A0ABW3ZJ42_9RHOB
MSVTRVAIVQKPTAVLDLAEGVRRAVGHIEDCAAQGAQLVVFPESWLTGYPSWVFGMAGWDDANARLWYRRFVDQCPTQDSTELQPIREAANAAGVLVSLGFNERADARAGSVFNSILLIGDTGQTLNLHRKLTPTHTERNIWAQGDAAGLRVVSTNIGEIGGLVCWEHWHPLARQALHAQNEQIHLALWPDMPEAHALAARHYAFEGRCFVAAAAHYLTVDDVPEELLEGYATGLDPNCRASNVLFRGGSGFVGPNGEWLKPQLFDEPGLIIADLDLGETVGYKHDLDVAGHYSRNDIFQLSVDRAPRRSVNLSDGAETRPGSSERAS